MAICLKCRKRLRWEHVKGRLELVEEDRTVHKCGEKEDQPLRATGPEFEFDSLPVKKPKPKPRATRATVWKRRNEETRKFEHNHVEDGWATGEKPVGKFDHQTKNWSKGLWMKEHVMLVGKNRRVERPLL